MEEDEPVAVVENNLVGFPEAEFELVCEKIPVIVKAGDCEKEVVVEIVAVSEKEAVVVMVEVWVDTEDRRKVGDSEKEIVGVRVEV